MTSESTADISALIEYVHAHIDFSKDLNVIRLDDVDVKLVTAVAQAYRDVGWRVYHIGRTQTKEQYLELTNI